MLDVDLHVPHTVLMFLTPLTLQIVKFKWPERPYKKKSLQVDPENPNNESQGASSSGGVVYPENNNGGGNMDAEIDDRQVDDMGESGDPTNGDGMTTEEVMGTDAHKEPPQEQEGAPRTDNNIDDPEATIKVELVEEVVGTTTRATFPPVNDALNPIEVDPENAQNITPVAGADGIDEVQAAVSSIEPHDIIGTSEVAEGGFMTYGM